MVTEAVKAAAIALLLEPFIIPPATWFETHVDFLSVHCTLVHDASVSRWRRVLNSVKHYAGHVGE